MDFQSSARNEIEKSRGEKVDKNISRLLNKMKTCILKKKTEE